MDAKTVNARLLTRDDLCAHYRFVGSEFPQHEWGEMAHEKFFLGSYEYYGVKGAVVHVVAWESNERVALVSNKRDERHPDKHIGIGVPTEEISDGEVPFFCAEQRVMREELALSSGFKIERDPITVVLDRRGILHFVFRSIIDEFTEIPKLVDDPAGEIDGAYLVNPFSSIRVYKEYRPGASPRYVPKIGDKEVYYTHLAWVALSLTRA